MYKNRIRLEQQIRGPPAQQSVAVSGSLDEETFLIC